ncbi:MAG: hypothetical protein GYA17_20790, partial [Chloroflexi bacterium]|nr:hypothetical protein [Chloroflexota bacterium]
LAATRPTLTGQGQTTTPERTRTPRPTRTATPLQPATVTSLPVQVKEAGTGGPVVPEVSMASEPEVLTYEQWMEWPVQPEISHYARQIYQEGLEAGTDAHAFSVVGDCQSFPYTFMQTYDTGQYSLSEADQGLQETIDQFSGSFSHSNITVIDGGNAATMLSQGWVNLNYCQYGENPLTCELRTHNPSIVFVNLGTHWSDRNPDYMRRIVETILEHGALPILSTKADDLEGDHSLNQEVAHIAEEYAVPMWNFWAAAQGVENGGLRPGDPMYLSEEGLELHRLTALRALDTVWRTVQ